LHTQKFQLGKLAKGELVVQKAMAQPSLVVEAQTTCV